MLKPQSSGAVVQSVLEELRGFYQDSFVFCVSHDDNDSGPAGQVCYLLQKWSEKWGAYIDVTTVDEICDGNRLTVIPKPTKSVPVSLPVCMYNEVLVKLCQIHPASIATYLQINAACTKGLTVVPLAVVMMEIDYPYTHAL